MHSSVLPKVSGIVTMTAKNEAKATILSIDDDYAVRSVIRSHLENFGYHVIEAEDGAVGLNQFRTHNPDVVLVDLRMPGVDGLEVLKTVVQESPDTPVIVVSGTGVLADAIETLQMGAWDYILKPIIDMASLDHTIQKSIEQVRLRKDKQKYQKYLETSLKKIKEDEEAGRKIQLKLLPQSPRKLGGYELTSLVMPSMYLSGDFVDYFKVNEDCIVFYTADVSGHGVSSALVTVLLKSFMRKHLEWYHQQKNDTIIQPAALMKKLNDELISEDLDKHITIFYAVLINSENRMMFANGGQFPHPVLWSKEGVEVIKDKGTAVGLFPFATFETVSKQLPENFLLAIFSDGVLDILPHDTLNQKLDYLLSLGTIEHIEKSVSNWKSSAMLPDDITVLTVRRLIDE